MEDQIKELIEVFRKRQENTHIHIDEKDHVILKMQEAFVKQSEIILNQTKAITECMQTFKSFTDLLIKFSEKGNIHSSIKH